jgi:Cytochrome c oxidase subunit IV
VRAEAKLLIGLGAFFAAMGVVYWLWSGEDAGGLMLIASGFLGFLPGSYYLWWSNRMRVRASDRDDATIADGAGFVETFPGSSIWPFTLGMGAFFVGLALVFGTWLALPAVGLVIWALLGAVIESRRGDPGMHTDFAGHTDAPGAGGPAGASGHH